MSRLFLALILSAFVQACASYGLPPEQLASVRSGASSFLVTSYAGEIECSSVWLNIEQVDGPARYVAQNGRPMEMTAVKTSVLVIAPGRYRIASGRCLGQDFTAELPLLGYWFPEFDVAPGAVVNLGTLTATQLRYRAMPGQGSQALNQILQLGDRADRRIYLAYDFSNNDAATRERLTSEFPDFVERLETRTLPSLLSAAAFRAALDRAYAPGSDGSVPSVTDADARVQQEVRALVRARGN